MLDVAVVVVEDVLKSVLSGFLKIGDVGVVGSGSSSGEVVATTNVPPKVQIERYVTINFDIVRVLVLEFLC